MIKRSMFHFYLSLRVSCSCLNPTKQTALRLYTTDQFTTEQKATRNSEVEEKRKLFQEIEKKYEEMLELDILTEDEKMIHALHAEAVRKGHFSYDDPVSGEKVLTRLRHFLKGKCCGKSCRHCIYEHSGVVDETKKSNARFNSSFWLYDEPAENLSIIGIEDCNIVTKRAPSPRKYAKNASAKIFRIPSRNIIKPDN